jgi:tetratricopeptide (TPR) repeat protein
MSEQAQRVRIVLVSPGDVAKERAAVQAVVEELNRTVAADRALVLSLWRWETDAHPAMSFDGPQGVIDELMDIEHADFVVGVFWKRFGTPTGQANSGTEHELRRAWAAWKERGYPQVMVYFCTRPYMPRTSDETAQWGRVLDFQRELPEQQLWWTYVKPQQFNDLLREHLTRYILRQGPSSQARVRSGGGRRVWFNLPAVAASFTGREDELGELDEALEADDRGGMITQAIVGLGGVGKSQLAARYAHRCADRYDIVAWIHAEEGGIADLAALAAKLGRTTGEASPSELAQRALDWLCVCEEHWLLVLDNVTSPTQLEGLLPRGGNGRVLMTSRDRALGQFAGVLTVDVFDEAAATRYLTDRAGRPDDEAAARQVARALGCLPLALSHAAAYCRSGTSFTEYLGMLEQLPAREVFDRHPEQSYAWTVASTWRNSITAATKDAPLASTVLDMAAYLGPDAIAKTLFGVLVHAFVARDRKRLADAFNALARYSLATVDDATVSVHRLLQKVVRDSLQERGEQTAARRALDAVEDAFPGDPDTPTSWPRCEQLLPHALTLADTLLPDGDSGPRLIGLLNRASDYLYFSHGGRRAVTMDQRIAIDAERILGLEHPNTLEARNNLAVSYTDAGRTFEAIAILEPLLADRERILGPEHPRALSTRNSLAGAYRIAGRTPEAIAIYEPLLADRERIIGPEHPSTLRTRHHLATAYQAAGRISKAIADYEALLADQERILGPEHPDTLYTRHHLATAYQAAGRIPKAIAIYEPLLADQERILGPEHPDTLSTRDDLASAHQAAG